ncbi:hypothetical protein GCM10009546_71590 [Actinomadura livida]|uniref:DUF397 domain-containing protein n=1 Tax=Actinomadura livida TaxID=79909 RepID=A0ABN1FWI4_9ACTN|nr:hypothetical protein GCM10010208_62440 [Actinomadura livida]
MLKVPARCENKPRRAYVSSPHPPHPPSRQRPLDKDADGYFEGVAEQLAQDDLERGGGATRNDLPPEGGSGGGVSGGPGSWGLLRSSGCRGGGFRGGRRG